MNNEENKLLEKVLSKWLWNPELRNVTIESANNQMGQALKEMEQEARSDERKLIFKKKLDKAIMDGHQDGIRQEERAKIKKELDKLLIIEDDFNPVLDFTININKWQTFWKEKGIE